jgi:O-antigen/teichoic acid export membrane protein
MALNLVAMPLPLIVMLFTLPYVIRALGPERYGIFALIWVVLGYLNLLNLGLGSATTKLVAEALSKGTSDRIPSIVATSQVVILGVGLFGAATLAALAPLLVEHVFNVGGELKGEARLALSIAALGVVVILVRATLMGVLEAYQRFDLINLIRVPSSVLTSVIPVLVLLAGGTLPVIVLTIVMKDFCTVLIYQLLCFKVVKRTFLFLTVDLKILPSLLSFGGWLTLQNVSGTLLASLQPLLISTILTMTALTQYVVPHDLISKLSILPASMMAVLFPAYIVLQGSRDGRLEEFFWKGLKYLVFFMGLAVLFLMILSSEILVWWLGSDFVGSVRVLQILAAGGFLGAISWHFGIFLQGMGYVKQASLVATFLVIFEGAFAWVLITKLGIVGAAMAFTITRGTAVIVFYVICLKLRLIVPPMLSITRLAKPIGMLLAVSVTTLVIKTYVSVPLWSTIFSGLFFIVGYLFVGWHTIFSNEERRFAVQAARRGLRYAYR